MTKHKKVWLLAYCVVLIGACAGLSRVFSRPETDVKTAAPAKIETNSEARKNLIGYPKSTVLDWMIKSHSPKNGYSDNLIHFSWFPGRSLETSYELGVSGSDGLLRATNFTARYSMNWNTSGPSTQAFKDHRLAKIKAILSTLPPSIPAEKPGDLLILSFRNAKGGWSTRIYDRAKLPVQVKKLAASVNYGVDEIK